MATQPQQQLPSVVYGLFSDAINTDLAHYRLTDKSPMACYPERHRAFLFYRMPWIGQLPKLTEYR
jgi:hypothetical protein